MQYLPCVLKPCWFIVQSELVRMAVNLATYSARVCHWEDGVIAFPGHLVGHVSRSAQQTQALLGVKALFHLSYHVCLVPAARGMGSQ